MLKLFFYIATSRKRSTCNNLITLLKIILRFIKQIRLFIILSNFFKSNINIS